MKKILLFILCVAALHVNAQGLKFGVHAGTDLLWYSAKNNPPFDESKMKSGFVVGGDVAYTFNNNVALASGISLLVSNGQFSALTEYYPVEMKFSEVNVKTMSLEIPLKVGYTFRLGSGISLTPMVGVYGHYGVDSFKGDVVSCIGGTSGANTITESWKPYNGYTSSRIDTYTISPIKRWDFGCSAELKLAVKDHYVISAGYMRGLINQDDYYKINNNSLRLTLGYVF